jgi:hypothetical protein
MTMIHIVVETSNPYTLCGKPSGDLNYAWGKVDNKMTGVCPECSEEFEEWNLK